MPMNFSLAALSLIDSLDELDVELLRKAW